MNEDNKVSMLLDIDNFYGEHEGRLGPTIKFVILGAIPVLLWVYTNFIIPAFIFWPLCVIWIIRIGLSCFDSRLYILTVVWSTLTGWWLMPSSPLMAPLTIRL